MPFWERHRDAMIVLAAFFGLLFLLWIFFLRGYDAGKIKADKDLKNLEKDISAFCGAGVEVTELQRRVTLANKQLEESIAELGELLYRKFPDPLIPPDWAARPQQYTRIRLQDLKDYVSREAVTKRGLSLTDDALTLGFALPEESTEKPEQDVVWLQQMDVIMRVLDLALSVTVGEQDTQDLLGITSVKALAPLATGARNELFMIEYPVELKLRITLAGLMKLLAKCSDKETFHVVQSLEILSSPENRVGRLYEKTVTDAEGKKQANWYSHYYSVSLRLAALTRSAKPEKKEQKQVRSEPARVIPH